MCTKYVWSSVYAPDYRREQQEDTHKTLCCLIAVRDGKRSYQGPSHDIQRVFVETASFKNYVLDQVDLLKKTNTTQSAVCNRLFGISVKYLFNGSLAGKTFGPAGPAGFQVCFASISRFLLFRMQKFQGSSQSLNCVHTWALRVVGLPRMD